MVTYFFFSVVFLNYMGILITVYSCYDNAIFLGNAGCCIKTRDMPIPIIPIRHCIKPLKQDFIYIAHSYFFMILKIMIVGFFENRTSKFYYITLILYIKLSRLSTRLYILYIYVNIKYS